MGHHPLSRYFVAQLGVQLGFNDERNLNKYKICTSKSVLKTAVLLEVAAKLIIKSNHIF